MAKRFSDTDKWRKPFIRALSPEHKLVWLYILDDCDVSGLWQVDWDVMLIKIGVKARQDEVIKAFADHIVLIDGGDKWFIPSFIEFQYGPELAKTNNIFKSIARILDKYDLYKYLTVPITDTGTTTSSFRGRISQKTKERIFLENDMVCQYCQDRKSISELVIDHFMPLNLGGGNEDTNLVCSCVRCNSHKTDIHPTIFLCKDFDWLQPTEKIISLNNSLKGGYKTSEGGKEKDMVKVNGLRQGEGKIQSADKIENLKEWGDLIVSELDHYWEQMRGRKIGRDEMDAFISIAVRNGWKLDSAQAFRTALNGFDWKSGAAGLATRNGRAKSFDINELAP